jgi:hypothetical protein
MAGDWIKMRIDLSEDPAVIGMAEVLGLDEFAVVGRLHVLWGWADSQSRDGHARGVTEKWIDRKVQCDGFAEAMAGAGWLLVTDGAIEFPHFDRHNGETAKQRGLATNRKKKSREKVTQDVTDMSRNKRDESGTREEKRREEPLKASARSPGADAQEVIVIDGNGNPITSVIANLTAAQSAVVVKACQALRKMGALRFHPGDEVLATLSVEGFTAEQIARCAGEKALRDAGLWNDPDVHPELFDLLVNGANQQDMGLTPKQFAAVRSAVTQVSTGYIASTLRGRRRDAVNGSPPARSGTKNSARKPSATDNFEGTTYVGTAIDKLPPEIRAGFEPRQASTG